MAAGEQRVLAHGQQAVRLGRAVIADLDNSEFSSSLRVEVGWPDRGRVSLRASQHGVFENCVAQVGAAQIRSAEICSSEMRALQRGPAKICGCQISMIQPYVDQLGAGEIGFLECSTVQPAALQSKTTQIHPRQAQVPL